MAALDPPCQPPSACQPTAGQPTAGPRRGVRAMITAAAVCGAVAVEVTGPERPVSFEMRLPLLVLVIGTVWAAYPARRPASARPAVPMVTPWLVLTSTAGVALLTLKVLIADPALDDAIFAVGAAVSLLAIGVCVTGRRRDDAARPDSADSLLGGVPGEAVGTIGVHAGGELGVEDHLTLGAEFGDVRE